MMKSSALFLAVLLAGTFAFAAPAVVALDSAPVKSSPGLAGKTIATLKSGTSVNKLAQKGSYTQIEFDDGTGAMTKGFIASAAITENKSVISSIGSGKRINVGSAKEALGAAGKGKTEASAASMDGVLDGMEGDDVTSQMKEESAAAPQADPSLDAIESLKIPEADLISFMRQGGLKSRLIK